MASEDLDELGKIEAQMQEACGEPMDAQQEPRMAAVAEDQAMEVDEEEESFEAEVKSEQPTARDGSKTKSKGFLPNEKHQRNSSWWWGNRKFHKCCS